MREKKIRELEFKEKSVSGESEELYKKNKILE
jgi:hypothetical protein